MVYQGSKARIADYILPFIKKHLTNDRWYVEPFCGGCNMLDKVIHPKRIANDKNAYLIALFKALMDGVEFPTYVSKEEYLEVRENKDKYPMWKVAYIGFICCFSGQWWGGYVNNEYKRLNDSRINRQRNARENLLRQKEKLEGVIFHSGDYDAFEIPANSVIYCDPPYAQTTQYDKALKTKFDSEAFWEWCRVKTHEGNDVLISEFNAPSDFAELLNIEMVMTPMGGVASRKICEKLFVHESIADKYREKTLFD